MKIVRFNPYSLEPDHPYTGDEIFIALRMSVSFVVRFDIKEVGLGESFRVARNLRVMNMRGLWDIHEKRSKRNRESN